MSDTQTAKKPRRHKWVTEALNDGEKALSVYPDRDEMSSEKKMQKFFEVIEKIGNDPRITNVERFDHPEYKVVFVFHIDANNG